MAIPSKEEILINQYQTAIDLYKHEDKLNWRKLNHLFYINIALWTLIGLVISNVEHTNSTLACLIRTCTIRMVSVIGIIVCLAFWVALVYGVKYLQSRKKVVIEIEETLSKLGATYIIANNPDDAEEKSPTGTILRLTPVIFGMLWLVVAIAAFL